MAAYEEDISSRRSKLRDVMLSDSVQLTKEIINEMERMESRRLEEMREQVLASEESLRARRKSIVREARQLLELEADPAYRDNFTEQLLRDRKRCNLVQMRLNADKRCSERELETLWHRAMLADLEDHRRREIAAEKIRRERYFIFFLKI